MDVSLLRNLGDGTFDPQEAYTVNRKLKAICAADLDGDGDLDIVTTNVTSDSVSVLLNNGSGSLTLSASCPVGERPQSLFAADLDGDGDLDLATANEDSDNVSVLLNQQGYICGDADGNQVVNISDVVFLVDYIFGDGPAPEPVESGDVDCNGTVNISDAVYLITYIFAQGPEPCADCP
jgi:hypothetical protein